MTIAGSRYDYRRDDYVTPRTQARYSPKLIPSKPIRSGLVRGVIAALRAYANRPYPKWRAF